MGAKKTFSTMKTNVGNFVDDTTATFASKIGVWINDAYQDAWRRAMWTDLIDDDFTFESVVDQKSYNFVTDMSISDFGEEVCVADIANGHLLTRKTIKGFWERSAYDYNADEITSGNPTRYKILSESGTFEFDPPPDTAETYAFPYKKTVSDLSGDSDTPGISTISLYLEEYGISIALAKKRKYSQATWWVNRAENTLKKMIKEEKVKYNQLYQRVITNYKVPRITRLTGDLSYDSI